MIKYALIPLLPLTAFIVSGLFGHWLKEKAKWPPIIAVLASFALSVSTLFDVMGGQTVNGVLYSWIVSGNFNVHIGFKIDQLTAVMLIVVTTVSSLVHIYSTGYMHGDKGYPRFFSYLALFTFSMLMLVMADNFLQLYVFWEAVGLCSYLLIGFWYEKKSASDAGKKAFIVNRVGDFGFGLGVMLIFITFGTLNYDAVFAAVPSHVGQMVNYPREHLQPVHRHRAPALHGSGREVRAASAACLAAGRHGRPHPGLRTDPCGDYGDRGHIHGGPLSPDIQRVPDRA